MREKERFGMRLAVGLAAGLLAAGGLVAVSVTPASAAPANGDYTLVNAGSGLCAAVPGQSTGDGVQLVQSTCAGGAGQVFTVTASGGGYQLKARHSGKCAGVRDASTSAGKAVQQEGCTGAASQTWQLTTSGSGYRVVNDNGGKCLNVKDNSTAADALLQQNSCDSVATKQWTLRPADGSSPDPTPTVTPTVTPTSGGGDGSGPWPTAQGSVKMNATQSVGSFFDGGMKSYYGIGDGGQSESQDPMFEVANGGTIQNVIIDAPAGDGIHCLGSCTIRNVWWNDVGEDAATFLSSSSSATYLVDGGGAKSASDKVFQHNGAGTVTIRNFQVQSAGKLYRACGNCSTSYQRHVVMNGVTARSTSALAGINTNWGDTARFSRITVYGTSTSICDKYKGVPKGSEPTKIGSGADGTNCIYSASDITYK
ncbi:pectate lyase [Nonomuraea sp. 3-1Str]|uniref:pectate lyase n=1 Tax=Nonomuraea sp. 3-1Str TaxID=2929801 RepID=UPI0028658F0B|nr:pectate lyase [Nonomuraea sp. 3-1Str]MDR8413963.1 pectate lyase [Nonomuraea sp. 3-1Str]